MTPGCAKTHSSGVCVFFFPPPCHFRSRRPRCLSHVHQGRQHCHQRRAGEQEAVVQGQHPGAELRGREPLRRHAQPQTQDHHPLRLQVPGAVAQLRPFAVPPRLSTALSSSRPADTSPSPPEPVLIDSSRDTCTHFFSFHTPLVCEQPVIVRRTASLYRLAHEQAVSLKS